MVFACREQRTEKNEQNFRGDNSVIALAYLLERGLLKEKNYILKLPLEKATSFRLVQTPFRRAFVWKQRGIHKKCSSYIK